VPWFLHNDVSSYVHPNRPLPTWTPAAMGLAYNDIVSQINKRRLRAVAADSVFASARWLIDHQLGTLIAVPDWFGPAVLALGAWEAGVSADAIAPVKAARQLGSRSLLVIHGKQDALFHPENARQLDPSSCGWSLVRGTRACTA
jgi:hypothetical protein